jgi:hypothetical protein
MEFVEEISLETLEKLEENLEENGLENIDLLDNDEDILTLLEP